jgi:hypothetical protein
MFRYDGGTNFQELTAGTPEDNANPAILGDVTAELIRAGGLGGGIGSVLYNDDTASSDPDSVEFFVYNAVGQRKNGGPCQPAQDDQAQDVRAREVRPLANPRSCQRPVSCAKTWSRSGMDVHHQMCGRTSPRSLTACRSDRSSTSDGCRFR